MKKFFICFTCFFALTDLPAQRIYENYVPKKGSYRIGKGQQDVIPYGLTGYTLIMPDENKGFLGTIISLEDNSVNIKDTASAKFLYRQASEKGLAVLYISTGIPVDLFFSEASLKFVDSVSQYVFMKYKLPNKNVIFQGVMTSGHRALKYIAYCKQGRSIFRPSVKGIILSECALDWVRQWYEGQKQVRDHLTEDSFFEGNLVTYLFDKNLKSTPVSNIEKYLEFSMYSYFDTRMRYLPFFKDIPVRAYTFADTDYWFSAQGKVYMIPTTRTCLVLSMN